MGHCSHGRAGLCVQAGIECYQDGLHADAPDMKLADFEEIARQCAGQTYQFALGGCGDPEQHEHLAEILQICHHYGIVPNYTTSELAMNVEIAKLCARACGAVAVSWYRSEHTLAAIDMLLSAGVRTNIHYVLGRNSLAEAVDRLRNDGFPAGINAVVFLLHKPVGLGSQLNVIPNHDPLFAGFTDLVTKQTFKHKIGFDSCTVPALLANPGVLDMDTVDTCEAGRWSAYISADMMMLPCSFDNQERRWSVDLRNHTIQEAWNSTVFEDFRGHFRRACPDCTMRASCLGGCPVRPEIVLCDKDERMVS